MEMKVRHLRSNCIKAFPCDAPPLHEAHMLGLQEQGLRRYAASSLERSSDGSESDGEGHDDKQASEDAHEQLLKRVAAQPLRASRHPAVVNEAVLEDEHNVVAPVEDGEGLQLEDLLNATELDTAARKQLRKLVTKTQVRSHAQLPRKHLHCHLCHCAGPCHWQRASVAHGPCRWSAHDSQKRFSNARSAKQRMWKAARTRPSGCPLCKPTARLQRCG